MGGLADSVVARRDYPPSQPRAHKTCTELYSIFRPRATAARRPRAPSCASKEEKAIGGTATVSYDQTHFGLPIWNAGLTVRVNTASMGVMGAQNATHYEIQVHQPA